MGRSPLILLQSGIWHGELALQGMFLFKWRDKLDSFDAVLLLSSLISPNHNNDYFFLACNAFDLLPHSLYPAVLSCLYSL